MINISLIYFLLERKFQNCVYVCARERERDTDRKISIYRFEGGANMRHKWVKMCSWGGCERKRTKEHLERGWVVVGGWEAEMHEWRRWGERAGEANRGQLEYEELACDGSYPGLILSVYSGWQDGSKGRLEPFPQPHTACSVRFEL